MINFSFIFCVLTSFSASTGIFDFFKNKETKYQEVEHIQKNIYVSRKNEQEVQKYLTKLEQIKDLDEVNLNSLRNINQSLVQESYNFLNIKGENHDTTYRIYIDSTGDKSLPNIEGKKNDLAKGKVNKNEWHNHLIVGLSLDVTKHAANKEEFLAKYKAININYLYMYNFWNWSKGWTNKYGKDGSFETNIHTFNLYKNNLTEEIFIKSDASHNNNEKIRLIMEQTWVGNKLSINWKLGVWYYWAAGSIIHHASLGQFRNDNYTLLTVPIKEPDPKLELKINGVWAVSNFVLVTSSKITALSEIDDKLKAKVQEEELKKAVVKFVPVIIHGYAGIKEVSMTNGIKICVLGINVVWLPDSIVVMDTNSILNGISIERSLKSIFTSNFHFFDYKNIFNTEQRTKPEFLDSDFNNMKLKGLITAPLIYLKK